MSEQSDKLRLRDGALQVTHTQHHQPESLVAPDYGAWYISFLFVLATTALALVQGHQHWDFAELMTSFSVP